MPLTVSGAARRVSARARGAARHMGAGPTSALPGPAPIDGRRPSKSLWLYTAAGGGCPSSRLAAGLPLTDRRSLVWPAGGRTPDRSRLLHPRRISSPNVFSKSSTRRIRKFPERQGSVRTPPPLAPGTRWAQAASRPVFWAPSPLSLIVPFASGKGDDAQDLPCVLLVRSADPHACAPLR